MAAQTQPRISHRTADFKEERLTFQLEDSGEDLCCELFLRDADMQLHREAEFRIPLREIFSALQEITIEGDLRSGPHFVMLLEADLTETQRGVMLRDLDLYAQDYSKRRATREVALPPERDTFEVDSQPLV